jgi:hypothetical protein
VLEIVGLGSLLVALTTIIHSVAMWVVFQMLRISHANRWGTRTGVRTVLVAGLVVLMFLVSLLESSAWAVALMWVEAFPEFEPAFYFSTVTFTTLGYGDLVIHDRWRLLATFEAANGIIIFGWTTAVIVSLVQRVYFSNEHIEVSDASR